MAFQQIEKKIMQKFPGIKPALYDLLQKYPRGR